MYKHIRKLLNHQRDILTPKAIEEIEAALSETHKTMASNAEKAALTTQMEALETAANKWLKPYPNAAWRENIEVLLVALTVAMGVRTFFLQPFKIPTGSMQPTLYGVTSENLMDQPDFKIPTGLTRVKEWFEGVSYIHVVAKNDGELQAVERPLRLLIFNIRQRLLIGGKVHTIWFPPDYGAPPAGTLEARANLQVRNPAGSGQFFHKGDDVVRLMVRAGDHLFVNRMTYNFRPPQRGEVIVFETHGITNLPADQQDTFYIKRLVGLSGDVLRIEKDYDLVFGNGPDRVRVPVGHLVVNGEPLSASTPRFENLYTFDGARRGATDIPYRKDHYYGHAMLERLSPGQEFTVATNHLFVMGDNTMNSSDSRYWGDFPEHQVIGKSSFVYWPITKRFGWSSSP